MHGNIYEIELNNDYGYGYVQTLLTAEFGLDNQILLRVLDYYSENSFTGNGIFFENIDDLVSPSLTLIRPTTTGKNKWRLIGKCSIPSNFKVPIFKSDPTTFSWDNSDWSNVSWYIIKDLVANGLDGGYTHNQVKHLPFWRHCTPSTFKMKLTMYWIKKHMKNIIDFIDIEQEYNTKVLYYEVINSVYYSNIKKESRIKPLLI